jgi:uncharacterized membrane protein YfcA
MDWLAAAASAAAVFVAYCVFAIAGFGTALISAPVLAQMMPVAKVVPLLSALDFAAAAASWRRLRANVSVAELKRLLPGAIIGSFAGASLLLLLPGRVMMALLGIFVTAYGLSGLLAKRAPGLFSPRWGVPLGFVGGTLGGMFGTGGFVYAIYLNRRVELDAMRATQGVIITTTSTARLIFFAAAGTYADDQLLLSLAVLFPAMALGMYVGHRVTLRLSQAQFRRFLFGLLVFSGLALVWRAAQNGAG